jgi:hypothetical protein
MKHYIRNAKQCFTDKNINITKIIYSHNLYMIYAKTFHYIPDMINTNVFYCSHNYFNKLKNNYSVYHGLPIITY